MLSLQQIGELSAYLSNEFKAIYDHIPWSNIKAFRNRIAHAYDGLDLEKAWSVVENEIPKLKSFVEGIFNEA